MARADTEFAITTTGLANLNRSLGKLNKDLRKESVRHLRETARHVRDDARPTTPVKTGKLRSSLRYSATNKGASVKTGLPYAGWIEYGGTIRPRGVPITRPPTRMLGKAVQRNAGRIEEDLGDLLDRLARSNGFH